MSSHTTHTQVFRRTPMIRCTANFITHYMFEGRKILLFNSIYIQHLNVQQKSSKDKEKKTKYKYILLARDFLVRM